MMSPEEMLALFTPQRRINPNTGAAVPKRGPSGRMEADFGVPGAVDPYEALAAEAKRILAEKAQQAGSAAAYPFTPNTWNGKQVINPNGQFGGKIMEYSPTQKAAAGTLGTGTLLGTGVAADNAMYPRTVTGASAAGMPSSASMNRADAPGIDEMSAYPPLHPSSDFMNRANAQGVDELSAYPSRPSSSFMDRSDRPGVDETSAYSNPLDRSGSGETSAYPHGAVQRQAPAARPAPMPPTRPAELAREQPSILSRIFSGQDYQSNNQPISKPMDGAPVNWGNPDSAADFFRASKALQQARPEMFQQGSDDSGHARGGTVGQQGKGASGNNAALHKALEIIHHMLMQRH